MLADSENIRPAENNTFYKYSAFFEKDEGVRGRRKDFFSREKKFFLLPRLQPLSAFIKQAERTFHRGRR